jgi:tetratricopeptide (TPR) repeat protein
VTGEVVATVLSPTDGREVEPGDVVHAEPAAPPPPPPALVSPASELALPAPPLPTIGGERAAAIAVPLHVEAIRAALRTRASAVARRELDRALALAPGDATLHVLEAWVEVREAGAERARLEALLERLQKLEANLPEQLELLVAKGELVEALGQREAARALYVRARALDADDRAVVEGLRRTSPNEKRGLFQSLLGGA